MSEKPRPNIYDLLVILIVGGAIFGAIWGTL